MAYTRVNWENYPSTNTPRNATNLNIMDEGLFNQDARITVNENEIDNLQTGWNSAGETWTYSSVDDPTGNIKISGNVTSKYSLGMRIKFTNGGNTIYGIITKISYSSPNTTLTFLHEIDPTDSQALHLMQNSVITNNYYSMLKSPFGFPINENKWSIIVTVNPLLANATLNSWYLVDASHNIVLPIGQWRFKVKTTSQLQLSALGYIVIKNTISTTTNSETDSDYTQTVQINSSSPGMALATNNYMIDEIKTITSKTTFYILLYLSSNGTPQANSCGYLEKIKFRAVCAYL